MGNLDSICSVAHAVERRCSDKQKSMVGGGRAGEGRAFFYRWVNGGKGALTGPHTLQKDTTPSSWRRKKETQPQETKRKARQALGWRERHASKSQEVKRS